MTCNGTRKFLQTMAFAISIAAFINPSRGFGSHVNVGGSMPVGRQVLPAPDRSLIPPCQEIRFNGEVARKSVLGSCITYSESEQGVYMHILSPIQEEPGSAILVTIHYEPMEFISKDKVRLWPQDGIFRPDYDVIEAIPVGAEEEKRLWDKFESYMESFTK